MGKLDHLRNLCSEQAQEPSRLRSTQPSHRLMKMRPKAQFAQLIGALQSAIARIGSEQYGRFSISVLHRIARHFDVATWVEFISFSTLLRRAADLSPHSMGVTSPRS